jgi:hypothetical protein
MITVVVAADVVPPDAPPPSLPHPATSNAFVIENTITNRRMAQSFLVEVIRRIESCPGIAAVSPLMNGVDR